MKPLGLSFFLLFTPAVMRKAGGRLFVDISNHLASPAGRKFLSNTLGKSDPLIKDALMTIMERADYIKPLPEDNKSSDPGKKGIPAWASQAPTEYDATVVEDLIKRSQTSIEELKQSIPAKSGTALFDFILENIEQLKKMLSDPKSMGVIMAAMNASFWINEKMMDWLGEKNMADILSHSVPNNITSEMGLALLDVADVIRPYPEVIQLFATGKR